MSIPFYLLAESGSDIGQRFAVGPAGATIGRHVGNEITLDDTEASRQHARVELRGGQVIVTDLGSANGTFVNEGRVVGSQALRRGDTIRIGGTILRLENGSVATASAGTAPSFQVPNVVGFGGASSMPAPGGHLLPALVPPPPATVRVARSNRLPLILGGAFVGLLLLCCGGGGMVFVLHRVNRSASGGGTSGGVGNSPASHVPVTAGHYTGRVTDERGQPIAVNGATALLFLDCTSSSGVFGDEVQTKPDARGVFDVAIPAAYARCTPHGQITVPYAGKQYRYALDPVGGDPAQSDAKIGIAQDYRWLLSGGPLYQSTGDGHYGGNVNLRYEGYPASSVPATAPITLTLTPLGPLADGSAGRVFTWTGTRAQISSSIAAIKDLPLANYRAVAIATLADGTTRSLNIGVASITTAPQTYDFVFGSANSITGALESVSLSIWIP